MTGHPIFNFVTQVKDPSQEFLFRVREGEGKERKRSTDLTSTLLFLTSVTEPGVLSL